MIKDVIKIHALGTLLFFSSSLAMPAFAADDQDPIASAAQITTQSVRGGELTKNYELTGENLVALIESMSDFTNPQSAIVFNRWTGQLFVKNTTAVHQQVNEMLSQIRRAANKQIEIEARIMTVGGTYFEQKGLDLLGVDFLSRFNHGNARIGTDTNPTDGSFNTKIDLQNLTDAAGANTGGQLSFFALARQFNISALIDFLEKNTEANTLSAPRLTVFNNQRAHIKIQESDYFIRELTTTSDAAATTAATEIKIGKADSGTVLDVTPTINRDKTITLELHPQFVTADIRNTQVVKVAGTGLIPTANQPFVTLPIFKNQSIDTTVTIEDGGVIMLGGLIDETESKTTQRVPGLWKIPFVGNLFQNKSVTRTKKHLLIFIRAHAIKPTALWSPYEV